MPNNDNRRRFGRDRSYINMSGKVGGKNYELIDVENLKEANKLMTETIRHQQEYINKLDERARKQEEISVQEREYYRNSKKNIEEMTKRMEDNNKVISGWNRNIQSNLLNSPNRANTIDSLINRANSNQRVPNTIADIFRNQMQQSNRKAVDEIYDKAVKSVVNSYKRKGADFTDPAVMNRVNRDIQDRVLANDEFNKITKKFGTKAELFNVAVNTFNKAISTWVAVASMGMRNQTSAYENTFENISVRNGTTRSQYYGAQSRLQSQLNSAGVFNNIASSEVQTMWNTLASNGVKVDLSSADQTAKAIETVITQHIVPYLDTSSKSFTIINERLNGKFVKDIRGINEANRELVGNNYATQDLLQQLIDEVQPMSDKALEDLAQGSAEITTMINSLIKAGWSEDAAKSYATQVYKMQRYSDQIMSSGSLTERMTLIDAGNAGLNPYDLKDLNDIMGIAVGNDQMIASWTPGYNGVYSGIVTNKVGSQTGVDYGRMMGALNSIKNGVVPQDLVNLSNSAGDNLGVYTSTVTNRWTNDQNQTNTQLQNITVENFMNKLAIVNEWLGNWAKVIETAIKGIGTILLTKLIGGVIGKGIGALAGLNGAPLSSLGGLGKLLGTAGPIALGVAAVTGVALAIKAGVNAAKEKNTEAVNNRVSNEVEAMVEEGTVSSDMASVVSVNKGNVYTAEADKNSFIGTSGIKSSSLVGLEEIDGKTFSTINNPYGANGMYGRSPISGIVANAYNVNGASGKIYGNYTGIKDLKDETKDEYGIEKDGWANWWLNDAEILKLSLDNLSKQQDWTKYNKLKLALFLSDVRGNEKLLNNARLALMIEWLYGTHDKSHKDFVDAMASEMGISEISSNFVKSYIEYFGLTSASDVLSAVDKLKEADIYLNDGNSSGNGWVGYGSVTKENLEKFNLHRYGLASVPYDEYPALLHQGEAVLTATTAAELRNLLEEYRQTSQQSVNFDNIIQRQTNALVNKMDTIIKTIESSKIGTFSHTDSMHKAKELLADSMRNMTSTKSF